MLISLKGSPDDSRWKQMYFLVARGTFPRPQPRVSHLFDGDLLPRVAVAHLDDVAAGAVAEVAQQLKVVDRSLHAHAVQLQQAVLQENMS